MKTITAAVINRVIYHRLNLLKTALRAISLSKSLQNIYKKVICTGQIYGASAFLQLLILYDKVPEMKLRPVNKFNQTCRASLTRIENENSSSARWELPWLLNFLITL